MVAVLSCNELSVGLMLGVWVLGEAAGALAGARLRCSLPTAAAASAGAALLAVPAAIGARPVLGLLPAETISIPDVGLIAAGVVLPAAFLHGLCFTLAVRALRSGGRGYTIEGAGTAVGAVLVSFLLLPAVSSLTLLALLSIPVLLAAGIAARLARRHTQAALALAAAAGCAVIAPFAYRIERRCYEYLWAGHRVVNVSDSRYSRIVTLERLGQSTVVAGGSPVFAAPAADPGRIEELVHLPLLLAPGPRQVLLIGQALGGPASCALRQAESVVAVQIDPQLKQAVSAIGDSTVAAELADPRLTCLTEDPRRYLSVTARRFDAIILLDAAPASLAGSRLFTVEFYRLCASRLRPGGLFAAPCPGPADRPTPAAARIASTRLASMRQAFTHVNLLALDFPLAVASTESLDVNVEALVARAAGRLLAARVLDTAYVRRLLDPFRQRVVEPDFAGSVATDVRPVELYLNMVREQRLAAAGFARWFEALERLPAWLGVAAVAALLMLAALSGRRGSAAYAVGTSGFAAACVSTAGLFGYQLRFGSMYSGAALLIGCFMTANVLGALLGRPGAAGSDRVRLGLADLVLLLAGASVPWLVRHGTEGLFCLGAAAAGLAIGFQFRAATARARPDSDRAAGRLVAVDLAGGFLGSVLTSLLLVPVFGLGWVAVTVVVVKVASLVSVIWPRRAAV